MFDSERFGSRIKYFRKNRNLTQEQLAELADIDPSYVSDIENGGRTPTLNVITALLNALSVNYSLLMSDDDEDSALTEAIAGYINCLDDEAIEFMTFLLAKTNCLSKEGAGWN